MLLPIIVLAVTLLGGGILIAFLGRSTKKKPDEATQRQLTANEFINVKDIRGNCLYTNDGLVMMYVRIYAISIDLYSKAELRSLVKRLTAELKGIQYPFKLLAVPRPVDISRLIDNLQAMASTAAGEQKRLLKLELATMNDFALSGDIVERQFYLCLWERAGDEGERTVRQYAKELMERFLSCGIRTELLSQQDIVRLCNLVHNPAYAHIDDTNFDASIPVLADMEGNYR